VAATGSGGAVAAALGAGVMADGGMSFIAGAFAAGAAASGFSGFVDAAEPAAFSAMSGLASSSAMMRRMDAKISSMEGSWTFAGCVISDSTSSTPSHAFYTKQFYTKQGQDLPVPDMQAGIFIAQA
jgi:hypothetical protein